MLEAIRARFPEEDAVSTLDDGAQAQIDDALAKLHLRNLDPKLLEVTTLKQKAQILVAAGAFAGNAADVADELEDLYERLRNQLMHAAAYVDDHFQRSGSSTNTCRSSPVAQQKQPHGAAAVRVGEPTTQLPRGNREAELAPAIGLESA